MKLRIEAIRKLYADHNERQQALGRELDQLLFFATYIGPLVIWTQDSRIGDLEHETEQLGAELYEVDH